jgi:anaerobic selenocysteine-containing dehydrogenase
VAFGSDTAGNDGIRRQVRAACPHDCPDTCAMIITVENGTAVKVAGAADHPSTDGFLCTKVNRYLERTYSPQRVLYPMKRVGEKGKGLFARITWDDALDTIAREFKRVADSTDGPQAILPYSYAGTMGLIQGSSMDRRFFHRLGASLLDRTICASAGAAGYKATIGASVGTDPERFDEARLIILWGANPITSNVHLWPKIVEARRKGARVIAIDPYRSLSAEKCDEHIALLPGTDGALALGMMNVIINENLIDESYIREYTLGFDELVGRVEEYQPERVARITGITAEVIRTLARDYAQIQPSVIRLNYGMQRHAGGGMAVRTVTCLPALVGAWRHPAGGAVLSTSGTFAINVNALERPDLKWNDPRTINMSAIGKALTEINDPPVKALYVYNSNPVAVAPDSQSVIAGFSRPDLFTVVHEIFQTDTADYADILLPATTQLEQFDLHKAYGHLYLLVNNPAIEPIGEAKPNSEVFRLLADRLGLDDPCLRDSDEDMARQALKSDHAWMPKIELDELKERGWIRLNVPERFAPFAEGNFLTPSRKCEFFSESLRLQGMDPLPTYIPPRESVATSPELAEKYPLALLSPPAHNFLNSSFANLPSFIHAEKEPMLDMHPDDAALRLLKDGSRVVIFNDRGSFSAKLRITDKASKGVVVALSIWWRKLSPDGRNVNDVTSQELTDLGAAATFYDVLVEVAPA